MMTDWENIEDHDKGKVIANFYKISEGKKVHGFKKVKRYYQKYQGDIAKIKEYTDLSSFYNDYQKKTLDDFYQYFIDNRAEIENIVSVLNRLHELGLEKLELDEESNFTDYEYSVNEEYEKNYDVNYVVNIDIIPNYQRRICYRSTFSPYLININRLDEKAKITLNSLLFDVDLLPDTVDGRTILDELKALKEHERDNCLKIRTAVNFAVGIKDFNEAFDSLYKCLAQLNIASQDELNNILEHIKAYIEMLRVHYVTYEASITQGESPITSELLEKERDRFLQLRLFSYLDRD